MRRAERPCPKEVEATPGRSKGHGSSDRTPSLPSIVLSQFLGQLPQFPLCASLRLSQQKSMPTL